VIGAFDECRRRLAGHELGCADRQRDRAKRLV
jgi:hypothetical protein